MLHTMDNRWRTSTTDVGGRTVAVRELPAAGPPIVICHAAPGGGRFDPNPAVTAERGVALLATDRPGYGASEPPSGEAWAAVDSAADDLARVLDDRSLGPVGVVGWSAGGRVAMALAARRPDLVSRLVISGTPAPDDEVPWIAPDLRAGIEAMRGRPAAEVHAAYAEQLAGMVGADADDGALLALLGAGEHDAAALEAPGARPRLIHMLSDAMAQGTIGLAADIAGYCLRPWGFEPAEVIAKNLLLYGAKDPVTGSRHATWWKRHLPDARVEMSPNAGHLALLPLWGRVLSHLAPRVRAA